MEHRHEIDHRDEQNAILLDVWREVCRHLEIHESVKRLSPILIGKFPAEFILVRHIDVTKLEVETVALGGSEPVQFEAVVKNHCTPSEIQLILDWCHAGETLSESASDVFRHLPGLVPFNADRQILAGPLNSDAGPVGVLIICADARQRFKPRHEKWLQALLEPFTVAMDNDRRLRELNELREAVEAENRSLLTRLGRNEITDSIVGAESGLKEVMEQVALVSRSNVPVLIFGETGSGKEVVARAIHNRSNRASKPFLRVNCGAIPPELIDSELFGHERGSFTGAVGLRKGWFERSDGGTLFLDECGELPPAVQVRLLRILQDGTFERVGADRHLTVDVRIIAATHRNLRDMVAEGRFREDLWYRIAVFPMYLPPLRDRLEDIPALAAHFAKRSAKRLGLTPLAPSAENVRLLGSYFWPGNVRELAAVMERAAILGNGKSLEVARALGVTAPPLLPANNPNSGIAAQPADEQWVTLDQAMARHIKRALAKTRGRVEGIDGAAELLGINPHTLRARMRKLNVDWNQFRVRRRRSN